MTVHAPHLTDALQRRQLALFIGADLPRDITGLPSRADLARELARRHGAQHAAPLPSLAEVAQQVGQGGSRHEYTSFIQRALTPQDAQPQPFHQRVVELVKTHGIATILTTAYDDMLEFAFRQMGVALHWVVDDSKVPFISPACPTLVYLYGKAGQPASLVVTEDDHYGLWRDRDKEGLLAEVRAVLQRNTVLFLGYNLADPDFKLLWREVLDKMGKLAAGAFAVWPGLPEADARVWRDRGITILDADPLGVLGTDGLRTPPPGLPHPGGGDAPPAPVEAQHAAPLHGGGDAPPVPQPRPAEPSPAQPGAITINISGSTITGQLAVGQGITQTQQHTGDVVGGDKVEGDKIEGGSKISIGGSVGSGAVIASRDAHAAVGPAVQPVSPPGAAERETLQRALGMARRSLAILEEQAAGYTALTIPAHLRIELEDKRREVTELEARLGGGAGPSAAGT